MLVAELKCAEKTGVGKTERKRRRGEEKRGVGAIYWLFHRRRGQGGEKQRRGGRERENGVI